MISALHLVSYLAGTATFIFVLLSLASGLLYVAEIIEEHSALAKTIGQRAIYVIILFIALLYFTDDLPPLCIVSHLVYLQNFSKTWPSISLTSPAFIGSCILVLVSHFTAFSHFSEKSHQPRHYNAYGNRGNRGNTRGRGNEETFMDVATFFGVCVWLIPFYLFLSLSANDNVLPSAGDVTPSVQTPNPSRDTPPRRVHARKQSSMMKSALSSALYLFIKPPGASNQREGLLASPRTSRPGSPTPYSPAINNGGAWGSPAPGAPPPRSPGFQPGGYGSPRMPPPPMAPRRATEGTLNLPGSPSVGGLGVDTSSMSGYGPPGLRMSQGRSSERLRDHAKEWGQAPVPVISSEAPGLARRKIT
ncbi:protein of transmembrane adaptor Erv26 family [Pseudohyphozyma bogoriensis]|nr:protein of transmembrane adaptor Erv26 family [Pseudohyphozyma bogoriensis]